MQTYHILILGANGQVGTTLTSRNWPPHIKVHAKSHQDLDIKNSAALEKILAEQKWNFIVNASSYVQVDRAEIDGMEPYLVNGVGVLHLATLCKKYDIPLLHYTTDYVFDGTKTTPYIEEDTPNPINTYGTSKLFGEMAIKAIWHKHIILRSSWVYGLYGRNFVKTILHLAKEKKDIKIVNDQHGSPTFAEDLAQVTQTIILQQLEKPDDTKWGSYHYVGEGVTTWYDYAKYILEIAYSADIRPSVTPLTTAEHRTLNPSVTRRPLYTALSHHHIQKVFGVSIRPWKEGVKAVIEQLNKS